jgi:hypothetical protein
VLTITGYLSRRKALTFSDKGLLLLVGDRPISQRVLCKKDFDWMALWGLNPEVLGSLWLMASATWGGNHFSWRPPWLGKAGRAPFELYPGICLTTEEKHEKLSQGSRVAGDYSLRRLSCLFMDSLGWPAEHQSTSVTRGWLQSALVRHRCLPSCRIKGSPHQLTLSPSSPEIRKCEAVPPHPTRFMACCLIIIKQHTDYNQWRRSG